MKLEDIKQEFPKMPEDMRAMVEREVEKQMKQTDRQQTNKRKKKIYWSAGRAAAVALAATAAFGTTVFAGVKLYRMYSEKQGNYGLVTKIEQPTDTENTVPETIPTIKMEATYLPEGIKAMEFNEGVYCYEDRSYTERYLSTLFLRMDQGDDAFEVLDKNVRSNENISLGGHDGIYFEKESLSSKKTSSHIYLAYPEVHYVLDLYIGSDIPKEEALKFAEGIRLTPTDDPEEIAKVRVEDWSDYIEREKSNEAAEKQALEETSSESEEPWLRVPTQDFEKTVHAIGESFSMYREYGIGGTPEFELDYLCYPGLDVTVNSVSVMDNVSSVSDSPFFDITPYAAEAAISEDGSLLPIPFDYIKLGNGIETTDYVVNTKKVTPKFVLAEVSYTNHGEQPLANVQVNSTLLTLREQDGSMEFCQMPHLDGYGSEWDICEDSFHLLNKECPAYFEIKNAASEKNYISNLQPGETAILVTGFFVAEEDLPYLYLNLDPYAGCYQFNETGLDIGYTDIRQK